MSLIVPGLYLGNMQFAQDKEGLLSIECKSILHVTNTFKPAFPEVSPAVTNANLSIKDFAYKVLSVNDMPQENLLLHFDDGVDFIVEALARGTTLVHW